MIQVEKVLGIDTPAHKAGLKAGDVLVEVQGELITMMTHPQVISLCPKERLNDHFWRMICGGCRLYFL